jgi:hypothetical protein
MGWNGLAIGNTLIPELLHQLERLDVLNCLAGNVATAIHLTAVDRIQEGVRIVYAAGQERKSDIEFTAG